MNLSSQSKSVSKVLWVPAPPTAGIVSMFRYWEELIKAKAASQITGVEVDNLVEFPEHRKRQPMPVRALEKYLHFPYKISRAKGYDVVHGLAHDAGAYMQRVHGDAARVVTVHDLIPIVYPHDVTPSQLKRFTQQAHDLAKMDKLVAISDYTASEIQRIVGVEREKIQVVPNGVDAAYFRRSVPVPKVVDQLKGKAYLFSVSGVLKRKNLAIFAPLFEELKRKGVDVAFVRAGGPLPDDVRERIRAVLGDDLIEVGRCNDDELVGLYQNAAAFLFPSFYEGFGLPVLEAMAASCPVVTANSSSLPEVAGDAAELFDPNSVEEMVEAVERVLEQPQRYVERGHARVEQFSWLQHYESLASLYQSF